MKKCLLVLILIVVVTRISAQDVVHLKNGSIFNGTIVEHMLNDYVKIETADGSLWVFNMDDVERIVFNNYRENTRIANTHEGFYTFPSKDYLKKGFRAFIECGVNVVTDDNYYYNGTMSFPLTLGYQINRYLFVGGGIEPGIAVGDSYDYDYYYHYRYDRYGDPDDNTHFVMPIYAALRYDIINAKISPFVDMRAGYSVTDFCRGAYFYVGSGCRIKRFNMSCGVTYQDRENYDSNILTTLRLGYEF